MRALPLFLLLIVACGGGNDPAKPTVPAEVLPASPAGAAATQGEAPTATTPTAPTSDAAGCDRIAHLADLPLGAPSRTDIDETIAICRAEGWPASVPACVASITSMSQLEPCLRPVVAPAAARAFLGALETAAAVHAAGGAGFPVGATGAMPARPCCAERGHVCTTQPGDWKGLWATLGFYLEGASPVQLTYESKAPGAMVARAIADLDCDGTTIVFELRGRMDGTKPVFERVEPDLGAD